MEQDVSDQNGAECIQGTVEVKRRIAAQLINRDRVQLEHQIRSMLPGSARRFIDTQEILSTALRRVDHAICEDRMDAVHERQFFAYLNGVIRRTMNEKFRGSVSSSARERIASRLKAGQYNQSGVPEQARQNFIEIGRSIHDPIDREIVLLRGRGLLFKDIADHVGLSHDAVRKRWQQIRADLRSRFGDGESV